MDIQKNFHMKGGLGETSYSKNSSLQKRVADKVKHITLESIEQVLVATRAKSIGIADLGCSSGPNTLSNIKELVCAVEKASSSRSDVIKRRPECRVYLNDLPTNDFNTIFQALPDLYRELKRSGTYGVYIVACPGTFYGRLFPDNCLHLVYSANSLHWLSRVPPGIYDEKGLSINRKSIYISERSPPQVSQAYYEQFQEDMSLFLRSRSEEVVRGGRMVLILGRANGELNSLLWELLYQSLAALALEGEVEEKRLEEYETHFYAPSKEELEEEVRKEGSFKVEVSEMVEIDGDDCPNARISYGMAVRSIQESMLAHHFQLEETTLDTLFCHFGRLLDQQPNINQIMSISSLLVLTKL